MFPLLETERLQLIEITETHQKALFDIFSKDEVTQFYGMSSLQEEEQVAQMIASFATNYENKTGIRWGIVLKKDNTLIGTIGLNNLRLWQKRAEIGYELHPAYWRQGYISEALNRVVDYCFTDLQLFRIGAITFLENNASFSLLEKAGFQKEGILRGYIYQDGKSHDTYVFSLLKIDKH
ncbi:MAG: GNAT family N-acetyltransferase [Bacillaceae bacterium]